MTKITFFQVDAFTDIAFKGNPAAVCLMEEALPATLLQQIAMENNLAETAFLLKAADGYNLRWFTPTVEIKLCGHATLASAHVLWEKGILSSNDTARFFTMSGLLTVTKNGDWIQLNFPRFNFSDANVPDDIIKALKITPVNTVRSDDGRFVIEVATEKEVIDLDPDFSILVKHETLVVTSKASETSTYDFISRSFTAAHGVNEDPVTGSSHCTLAPYWAAKSGKTKLSAYQASARGGALKLQVEGDRVLIEGRAVTVIEGLLRYPGV